MLQSEGNYQTAWKNENGHLALVMENKKLPE